MTNAPDSLQPSQAQPPAFHLRAATPGDVAAIVGLIGELAVFERLEHLLQATPEKLAPQLFGPRPVAEAVVVTLDGNPEPVAFALYFHSLSTFLAQPGLYLEDLYVQPAHRGRGIGQALLRHLAGLARDRGCGRFEWSVLDWNEGAIGFYRRMGAAVMDEWRICRVDGDALEQLAGR